jgi:hypothetical protein
MQQQHLHVHRFQVFIQEAYQKDTPPMNSVGVAAWIATDYLQKLRLPLISYKPKGGGPTTMKISGQIELHLSLSRTTLFASLTVVAG